MRRIIRENEPPKPSTRLTQELVAAPRQSAADFADGDCGALTRRTKERIDHAAAGKTSETVVADSTQNGGTDNLQPSRVRSPAVSGYSAFNCIAPITFKLVPIPRSGVSLYPVSWVWPFSRAWIVGNANGVLKQSPRLAQSAYLGSGYERDVNPNGLSPITPLVGETK